MGEKEMKAGTLLFALVVACAGTVAIVATAKPGDDAHTRTWLQKADYPKGYETSTVVGEIGPGGCSARHTHPGIEISYILQGEMDLKVEGQPDRHLKAGDSLQIAPGVPHIACSPTGLKVIAAFVVEKGKPFATVARD